MRVLDENEALEKLGKHQRKCGSYLEGVSLLVNCFCPACSFEINYTIPLKKEHLKYMLQNKWTKRRTK